MPQNPELLALQLREAKEQARVWEAHKGIKESPPGPERERQRGLYDTALGALQRAGEAISLWWLGQPRDFSEEDEMDFAEARGAVQEGLLDLGYSYPIQTSRARGRNVQVVYHAPDGTEYTGKVRFHQIDEWLAGLPEPPEPDLDTLAREQGKTVVNGELVELPKNIAPCDDECDKGEECPAEQAGDHRPGKCDGEAASLPGNNWKEEAKDIQVTEEMIDDVARAIGGHMVPNGDGTRSFIGDKEEPVEEKELPPLEKAVEIKVTKETDISILQLLRWAHGSRDTILIEYQDAQGNVSARHVQVIGISTDETRFHVHDGQSGEVRKGWYVERVLSAYPAKTKLGKFANKLVDYGKEDHTVPVQPVAGNPLLKKWGKLHWATEAQAERLISSGNWERIA